MKSHTQYYHLKKMPDLNKEWYKDLRLTYQSKAILTILQRCGGKLDRESLLEKISESIFTHQKPSNMLRWWQSKMQRAGLISVERIKST